MASADRDIHIAHLHYDKMVTTNRYPVSILVIGKNDEKRKTVCANIVKGIEPSWDMTFTKTSPFTFFESEKLKILSVRQIDDETILKKVKYVVLMDEIENEQKQLELIWEATGCKQAVSKYKSFEIIYKNCASLTDVFWIDVKTDTTVIHKKMYYSTYNPKIVAKERLANEPKVETSAPTSLGPTSVPPTVMEPATVGPSSQQPPVEVKKTEAIVEQTEKKPVNMVQIGNNVYTVPEKVIQVVEEDEERKPDSTGCKIL